MSKSRGGTSHFSYILRHLGIIAGGEQIIGVGSWQGSKVVSIKSFPKITENQK
ncbi:hypothetical protein [Pleomorphovibrio marinus]|uniref:hypothetical protein n=1 Tax=Pleomorphovibrio marinus TaxID=2164132 RepID=UPI0013003391|nr:hypothetical protein [Pleomorphovibrio marinus]